MDVGSYTFTTLSLGSTLGLVIITCIGLSSNGALPVSSSHGSTVLDYVLNILDYVKVSPPRAKLAKAWRLLKIVIQDYVFSGPVSTIGLVRDTVNTYRDVQQYYHERYGECSWRNFSKLLRTVKVWEPLPYDLMVGASVSALAQPLKNKLKYGLVGVCLRFPMGNLRMRTNRRDSDRRLLYGRELSVPAYLPLEEDGSLRVDLIRDKFYIEEVELLIPGRYEVHRVSAGDRISAFLLHQLMQQWGYLNVVEHEDIYCQKRRRFRQWLRSTRIHYFARLACFIAAIIAIAVAACIPSYYASHLFSGILWWCVCHSFGVMMSTIGYATLCDFRRMKPGLDNSWHTIPQRYSAYWLKPRVRGRYL